MQSEFIPLPFNTQPKEQDFLNYLNYLKQWLQRCLILTKKNGFVFGLSGGIDSGLIAAIIDATVPKTKYLAITMHIDNPQIDHDATDLLIKHFGLTAFNLELQDVFRAQLKAINVQLNGQSDASKRLIVGNIKARLRALNLYAVAQSMDYLVVGTTNYDEWMSGYYTKFGDNAADLTPLKHLLKGDINQLAQLLNVPKQIIHRSPTASLYQGQTDETELGFTYQQFDQALSGQITPIPRMVQLFNQSQHKRNQPLMPFPFRILRDRF